MRISTQSVEDAILSSFLFAPMMNDTKSLFKLNVNYFTTSFGKRVAENINEAIEKDTLGMLDTMIEEKVTSTRFHIVYIEILAQTPMPISLAKQYHNDFLRKRYNSNLAKGIIV